MDVLLKSFQGAPRQTSLSGGTPETFLKALPRFLHKFKSPCINTLKIPSPTPQTDGSSGVNRHQENLRHPWSLPKKCWTSKYGKAAAIKHFRPLHSRQGSHHLYEALTATIVYVVISYTNAYYDFRTFHARFDIPRSGLSRRLRSSWFNDMDAYGVLAICLSWRAVKTT